MAIFHSYVELPEGYVNVGETIQPSRRSGLDLEVSRWVTCGRAWKCIHIVSASAAPGNTIFNGLYDWLIENLQEIMVFSCDIWWFPVNSPLTIHRNTILRLSMFFGSFLGFDLLLNIPDFARQPSKEKCGRLLFGGFYQSRPGVQQNVPPHLPSQPSHCLQLFQSTATMDRSRMVRDDSDM